MVRTIFVFPLVLPVAMPCTENFSESSSSAIDAISTSVISVELDGDIAVSPISLRRFATYLHIQFLFVVQARTIV